MSPRHVALLAYLMLLLIAATIWAGKTMPADGLWCAAFATMLLFASAIEARRAETPSGSVADKSAVPQGDAHE